MLEDLWNQLIAFSEQFIVPDWGALVALLPVFLAVLVVVYVAWLLYRFATMGPKRRGMRKLTPVTPEGIHMPGPSFAPVLAAFGAFMTLFGLLAGGIWLWVGLLILLITLLYWGREALRDYDHLPDVAAQHAVVGALPAPSGTPPKGVHIPPPSFRPVLVAIAMTILVAGMIAGGVVLLIGLVAVAATGIGWLRDARREYVAVETADRTGHLDTGGAPAWPKATFAALAILILVALVVSTGLLFGLGGGTAAPSGGPVASAGGGAGGEAGGGAAGGGASQAPAASLPAADVTITAQGIQYLETSVTVPAGRDFTIAFDNRDNGVPHDIVIKDGGGATVFQGEIITGVAVTVYDVPALPAGQYGFVCSIHPNMTGTMTAQ